MFASIQSAQLDDSAERRIPGLGPRRPRKQDEATKLDVSSSKPTSPRKPAVPAVQSTGRPRPLKPYEQKKHGVDHAIPTSLPSPTVTAPRSSSATAIPPPSSTPAAAPAIPTPAAPTPSTAPYVPGVVAKKQDGIRIPDSKTAETRSKPKVPLSAAPAPLRKPMPAPNWSLAALFGFCFSKLREFVQSHRPRWTERFVPYFSSDFVLAIVDRNFGITRAKKYLRRGLVISAAVALMFMYWWAQQQRRRSEQLKQESEELQRRLQHLEVLWKQDCAEWSVQNERLQKLLLERLRHIKDRFSPRWDDIYAELRAEQDELTSSAMLSSSEATLVTVFDELETTLEENMQMKAISRPNSRRPVATIAGTGPLESPKTSSPTSTSPTPQTQTPDKDFQAIKL